MFLRCKQKQNQNWLGLTPGEKIQKIVMIGSMGERKTGTPWTTCDLTWYNSIMDFVTIPHHNMGTAQYGHIIESGGTWPSTFCSFVICLGYSGFSQLTVLLGCLNLFRGSFLRHSSCKKYFIIALRIFFFVLAEWWILTHLYLIMEEKEWVTSRKKSQLYEKKTDLVLFFPNVCPTFLVKSA